MSGDFNTTVSDDSFQTLNFQSVRPTIMNQSLSGRRVARQLGSQYFSFSVKMPPLVQADAMSAFAFLQKQKGGYETFTIKLPTENRGASKGETDILVNGAHTAGDTTIALDGFAFSTTGALKAGDLIKFANHSKVYMVENDIDSSGTGTLTVQISPGLAETLANDEAVTVNRPAFTVYLTSQDILYSTDASGFYNIQFDVREVIS